MRTEIRLVGLNAQLENVIKSEGENSAAAQKLKQDVNNTTAALNKAEFQLKNNKNSLDNHEKALKDNAMAAIAAAKSSEEFKNAQDRLKKFRKSGSGGFGGGLGIKGARKCRL